MKLLGTVRTRSLVRIKSSFFLTVSRINGAKRPKKSHAMRRAGRKTRRGSREAAAVWAGERADTDDCEECYSRVPLRVAT